MVNPGQQVVALVVNADTGLEAAGERGCLAQGCIQVDCVDIGDQTPAEGA